MDDVLIHYGVLGMKWGVRRYQNKDGSLTSAGKKRISKEYKKASIAGDKNLRKRYNSIYVDSYNKTANKMNSGGIEKFNKEQKEKYGENYAQREGYESDYINMFNKELSKTLNKSLLDFTISDKNYRKADELVKRYNMTSWDELAKANQDGIEQIRKSIEG